MSNYYKYKFIVKICESQNFEHLTAQNQNCATKKSLSSNLFWIELEITFRYSNASDCVFVAFALQDQTWFI